MKNTFYTLLAVLALQGINAQWTQTNLGGSKSLVEHNNKLFAIAGTQNLVVSTDNGTSWTDITTDTLSGRQDFLASAGNRLYLATYNNFTAHGLIYYSTDDGVSWDLDTAGMTKAIFQPPGKADVRTIFAYNNDQLVANFGGADAYYTKSITDARWRLMPDVAGLDPDFYTTRNDTLVAFGTSPAILFSTDNGISFSTINSTGLPNSFKVTDTYWDKNGRIYLAVNNFSQSRTGLYFSNDFGSTWDSLNIFSLIGTDFTSTRQNITALYANGTTITFSLYNDKANTTADIFTSIDAGQTFIKDTVGLKADNFSTEFVLDMVEVKGRLFSMHSNTDIHYKTVSGTVTLEEGKKAVVFSFYPNPAKNQILLTEHLSDIEIIDNCGKRCAFLENGKTLTFDLPTGMYLIKGITAKGKIGLAKLMVD